MKVRLLYTLYISLLFQDFILLILYLLKGLISIFSQSTSEVQLNIHSKPKASAPSATTPT